MKSDRGKDLEMNILKTMFLFIAIGLSMLSISACSEERAKPLTAAEEAKARLAAIEAKYSQDEAPPASSDFVMPDWAPDGFPFPDNTAVVHHTGNLYGGAVNLRTRNALQTVVEFYLVAIPEDGWELGASRPADHYYLFKKNGQQVIITVLKEPGDDSQTRTKMTFLL